MPQGITPQAASQSRTCLPTLHTWERTEEVYPKETKIKGVVETFGFSAQCTRCEERKVLKSHDVCPYCLTTMETKPVNTRMEQFRGHTDAATRGLFQTNICTCPTCSFRCVQFFWDK